MANYQSAYTGAEIDTAVQKINNLIDLIYPIGSIYMSINSTNPSELFGGTWVAIQDRFLIGAGNTYNNGATGGEANHTLTANEMPSHSHSTTGINIGAANSGRHWLSLQYDGNFVLYNSGNTARWEAGAVNASDNLVFRTVILGQNSSTATDSKGSGNAHNNLPPYLAVHMWRRTG